MRPLEWAVRGLSPFRVSVLGHFGLSLHVVDIAVSLLAGMDELS